MKLIYYNILNENALIINKSDADLLLRIDILDSNNTSVGFYNKNNKTGILVFKRKSGVVNE